MAAKWTRITTDFLKSRRLRKSAKMLGITECQMRGHLVTLWLWCMENREDGYIGSYSVDDVAIAAEWDGNEEEFFAAIDGVWVIQGYLHGWNEHEGKVFAERKYERNRKASKHVSAGSTAEVQRNSGGNHFSELAHPKSLTLMQWDELASKFGARTVNIAIGDIRQWQQQQGWFTGGNVYTILKKPDSTWLEQASFEAKTFDAEDRMARIEREEAAQRDARREQAVSGADWKAMQQGLIDQYAGIGSVT